MQRMMFRRGSSRVALGLAVACAMGCGGEPTAAGTKVLEVDTQGDIPTELNGKLDRSAPMHSSTHPLVQGTGQVQIDFHTADAPGGGKYILDIAVIVKDAAGYQVTAGAPGSPVNRGTVEAPLHTRMVHVAANKKTWSGTTSGTTMFTLHADGTVTQ